MSQLFSDATIEHFEEQCRLELSSDARLRVVRYSPLVSTNIITLPSDCDSVISITWLGIPLIPLPSQLYENQGGAIFQGTGLPQWYVYNSLVAQQTIQLFLYPSSLPMASVNVNTGIQNGCVITYKAYCTAVYEIPDWMQRNMFKLYVQSKCFAIEGPGQNLKNAEYCRKRYLAKKAQYLAMFESLNTQPRKLIVQGQDTYWRNYNRRNLPVLPSRFGIPCDDQAIDL